MGKWAKSHVTAKKKGLTPSALKGIWSSAKDDLQPDVPGESPEDLAARDRQATELARLDEEENRRIKTMFTAGGGRKMFRSARAPARASQATGSAVGGTGATAAGGRPAYSANRGTGLIP